MLIVQVFAQKGNHLSQRSGAVSIIEFGLRVYTKQDIPSTTQKKTIRCPQ